MQRYVCVHGHFYQPPRENPWLESIERQDSARPYHDWNERITAESYSPNAASRILDGDGKISAIVNNYARMSFNFGPTLLGWMQHCAPETYAAILEADRESAKRFSGHGSALAQGYNHMIMPLANRRDKRTQIVWGVRDFEHRFGRRPEGMWLGETAIDLESLDMMAAEGILYTVLAPRQARRVRRIGGRGSKDVSGGRIDPKRPYLVRLPSKRQIAVFFYDGPIAQAVAFEGLLSQGEKFAGRMLAGFPSEDTDDAELVHIATDGETYGHHHRHGEMALAYGLDYIERNQLATLTNYGEFLERHPPTHAAWIFENSSWSCVHGVERWRSDCGCNSGMHGAWSQAWRAPLREALDWLRDALAPRFEAQARRLLKDPWAARDDYIEVVLDRTQQNVSEFLGRHAARELAESDRIEVLKLLEMQRHAMLMYTSCGWFFDELSGLETVQVIQFAARALQLAEDVFDESFEAGFLERLAKAPSNIPDHGDGQRIYEKFVKPAMVDLLKVSAHYAVSTPFESYAEGERVHCYEVQREDYQSESAGKETVAVGRARIRSVITGETKLFSFGVVHLGDHNLQAGVREYGGDEAYQRMLGEVQGAFAARDFAETVRALDRNFSEAIYSLKSLFKDEQSRILGALLESSLAAAEAVYGQLYAHQASLMHVLAGLGQPPPRAFRITAEFVLNTRIRRAFESDAPLDSIQGYLREAKAGAIDLDGAELGYVVRQAVERKLESLREKPDDRERLAELTASVELANALPFEVDLWRLQNGFWRLRQEVYPSHSERHDEDWLAAFRALGAALGVGV